MVGQEIFKRLEVYPPMKEKNYGWIIFGLILAIIIIGTLVD